jgi:hypothetical protein
MSVNLNLLLLAPLAVAMRVGPVARPTARAAVSRGRAAAPRLALDGDTGDGGDLAGGGDANRLAQLESLRKMFSAPSHSGNGRDLPEHRGADVDARKLGLLLDLPVCRFSSPILPHHQVGTTSPPVSCLATWRAYSLPAPTLSRSASSHPTSGSSTRPPCTCGSRSTPSCSRR